MFSDNSMNKLRKEKGKGACVVVKPVKFLPPLTKASPVGVSLHLAVPFLLQFLIPAPRKEVEALKCLTVTPK